MNSPYHSESQQRILKVMLVLFGHEIDGLSPTQIKQLAKCSGADVTRCLHNLEAAGLVERLTNNNNARITPMLGQKALAVLSNLDKAANRIDETRNRFTVKTN